MADARTNSAVLGIVLAVVMFGGGAFVQSLLADSERQAVAEDKQLERIDKRLDRMESSLAVVLSKVEWFAKEWVRSSMESKEEVKALRERFEKHIGTGHDK